MDNLSFWFLLISILILLTKFIRNKCSYWERMGVPFEKPTFPYGNVQGVGVKYHLSDITMHLYNTLKEYKTPFVGYYSFLMSPIVLVVDMDFAKTVLVKDSAYFLDRGQFYNEEDDPVSAHLFAVDNPKWKILRTKLTPTFTSGKMKMMFGTVCDVADRLNKTLAKESLYTTENAVEIKDLMARFTTDVIGSVAFGLECNSLEDPKCDFRSRTMRIFDSPRHSQVFSQFLRAFKGFSRKLHIKVLRDEISEFFMKMVKDTVKYREESSVIRNDFMHLMVQLKNKDETKKNETLTIEEIVAQSFIFFAAGFETSSSAMTSLLFELSRFPDIQEKVREEVKQVLTKYEGKFTYEALSEMNYLESCIYETLRKYPALGNLTRVCGKDYQVENTNFVIKKGQQVFIPAKAFHYDPEFYPNPHVFDPDRFKTKEQRGSFHFMSFGQGPRNCIGLRFGVMQTKIGLSMLLTKFKFKTCSKSKNAIEFANHVTILQPKEGVYLKVTKI